MPSENTKIINLVVFFPFFPVPVCWLFFFPPTINCGYNKCLLSAHLETFSSLMFLNFSWLLPFAFPVINFHLMSFTLTNFQFLLTKSSPMLSVVKIGVLSGQTKTDLRCIYVNTWLHNSVLLLSLTCTWSCKFFVYYIWRSWSLKIHTVSGGSYLNLCT